MVDPIYRKLAERLDAIPNGFPATASGVELRLLAKIFTPEEAALAAVMRLSRESAADIAGRAGVDPEAARLLLREMVRKGQIHAGKGDGEMTYGLMPFAVGISEAQLSRIDAELAGLFEAYYKETHGGTIVSAPSIHRVIPVAEAVTVDLEIFAYETATRMVEEAQAWAVQDCICRLQKQLIGDPCEHPLEMCLVFAPVPHVFDHSQTMRAITREEALGILQQAQDAGLVHTTGNYQDGHTYICNCCTCSCGVLRGIAEFDLPAAVARSDFRAVVDVEECLGCETCVTRCQFDALEVDEVCRVDYARCVGCGQCTTVCTTGAMTLERRPAGEVAPPPLNHLDWLQKRADARGLSLEDVL